MPWHPLVSRNLVLALLSSVAIHGLALIGARGPGQNTSIGKSISNDLKISLRTSFDTQTDGASEHTPIRSGSVGTHPPSTTAPSALSDSAKNQVTKSTASTNTSDSARFYLVQELDRPPRPRRPIDLEVLPELQLLTSEGAMRLTLWINPRGEVVGYQVEAPELPEEYASAVAHAFASTKFIPGLRHGEAASSVLRIEVRHSLQTPSTDLGKPNVNVELTSP